MTEIPFRSTIEDGAVSIPDSVKETLQLEDGDIVVASIMLNSGDVPSKEEIKK